MPSVVINTAAPPETKLETAPKPKTDFFTQLRELSPQDWTRHMVYLYRTKPLVGMKVKEKYLDVFAQPFTIEEVKAKYGGEEFKVMLTRDGKMTATEEFAIEAPPKYDMIRENPMGGNGQAPSSAAAAGEEVTRKITDQFLEERRGENEMLTEAHRKSLEIVADGFRTVQANAPAPSANGNGNIIDTIRVLKELGLVGQPAAAPRSLVAELGELLTLAKSLGINLGGGGLGGFKEQLDMVRTIAETMNLGGGSRRGGGDWVSTLIDHGPDLLGKGVEALGKYTEIQAKNNEALRIKAQTATAIAEINRQRAAAGVPPIVASEEPAMASVTSGPPTAPGEGSVRQSDTPPHPAGGLHVVPIATDGVAAPPAAFTPTQQQELEIAVLKNKVVQMISRGLPGPTVIAWVYDAEPMIITYLESLDEAGLSQFFAQDAILQHALTLPQWEKWFAEACQDLYAEEPAEPVH